MIFTIIFICVNGINMIVYNLHYLEKVPQEYFCTYSNTPAGAEPVSCKPEDFCDDPNLVSYEANMALDDSYDNLVGKLDLVCMSPGKIGFIGSSIFIGWFISLVFVPRLADLYGRKKLMIGGLLGIFLAYTVLMFTESYSLFVAAFFICGVLSTVRIQVCIIYMFENMPGRSISTSMTVFFCLEAVLGIWGSVYFTWVSKDWFWFLLQGYVMQALGAILVFCIPESPKWLVKSGLTSEAKVVLDSIAERNSAEKVNSERIEELFG